MVLLVRLMGMLLLTVSLQTVAGIEETDKTQLQKFFLDKFDLPLQGFQDGAYALNADKRLQFQAIMEFPPFEEYLEKGEALWKKPFANGKTFADCFGNDTAKIRSRYPYWDAENSQVETLESAIQTCLVNNGEKPWKWKKGKLAYVSAYLTTQAAGQPINVVVPDDAKAQAAYQAGKTFFFAKRGQLNLACADCHINYAGGRIRGNILSTTIGQTTHFPVWRGKWARDGGGDGFGTLHRRFGGCNKQVRAKPFKAQSEEYRNLEYFLTAMSNGMNYSGTAYRE